MTGWTEGRRAGQIDVQMGGWFRETEDNRWTDD